MGSPDQTLPKLWAGNPNAHQDEMKPYIVHFGPAVLLIDSQGHKRVLGTREIIKGKEYVLDQEGWKLRPFGDLNQPAQRKPEPGN